MECAGVETPVPNAPIRQRAKEEGLRSGASTGVLVVVLDGVRVEIPIRFRPAEDVVGEGGIERTGGKVDERVALFGGMREPHVGPPGHRVGGTAPPEDARDERSPQHVRGCGQRPVKSRPSTEIDSLRSRHHIEIIFPRAGFAGTVSFSPLAPGCVRPGL